MMGLNCAIWRRAILIVAAMVLMSLVTAPIVLAVSQTWYLTDIASGSNYIMQKGGAGGGGTSITISPGAPVVWIADEAAQTNVGFTSGTWGGKLKRASSSAPARGTAYIGVWEGLTFTSAGSGVFAFRGQGTKFRIPANAFDVPQGSWLAFKIEVGPHLLPAQPFGGKPPPPPIRLNIVTDGSSYVASPSTDPGYPVPDVGAWIMFTAGLGVVGLILLKLRNRQRQMVAS
jgi:hypothetical protein